MNEGGSSRVWKGRGAGERDRGGHCMQQEGRQAKIAKVTGVTRSK